MTRRDRDPAVRTIHHLNDLWRVLAVGATREDGKVYLHLASLTREQRQRNGCRPVQMADWFEPAVLESAGGSNIVQGPVPGSEEQGDKIAMFRAEY